MHDFLRAFDFSDRQVTLKGMHDVKGFRIFLGPAGEQYSDAQLEQLEHETDTVAELLLELHFSSKNRPRQRGTEPRIDVGTAPPMMKGKGRKHITQF